MCGSGNCDVSTPAGNSSDSVFVSVSRVDRIFRYCGGTYGSRYTVCGSQHTAFVFVNIVCWLKRWKSRAEINAWSYGKSWGSYDNIPQRLYKTGYSYKSQAVLRFINIHFGGKQ